MDQSLLSTKYLIVTELPERGRVGEKTFSQLLFPSKEIYSVNLSCRTLADRTELEGTVEFSLGELLGKSICSISTFFCPRREKV